MVREAKFSFDDRTNPDLFNNFPEFNTDWYKEEESAHDDFDSFSNPDEPDSAILPGKLPNPAFQEKTNRQQRASQNKSLNKNFKGLD